MGHEGVRDRIQLLEVVQELVGRVTAHLCSDSPAARGEQEGLENSFVVVAVVACRFRPGSRIMRVGVRLLGVLPRDVLIDPKLAVLEPAMRVAVVLLDLGRRLDVS